MIKRAACVLAVVLVIAGPTAGKREEALSADTLIRPQIKASHLQAKHVEISTSSGVGVFTF